MWSIHAVEYYSALIRQGILFFLIYFKLEDDYFALLCWFLPYTNVNQPQVCICPLPLEPPSHPPTPSHPSRLSQSTGLSSLHHTANSNQLSVLHMVMYMFQCYSLNSSHVLPSPLCPQVCSLKETGNSDACCSVEEH